MAVDEQRRWLEDRRDFVADRRDEVADQRDRLADDRERAADDREAEFDAWERRLDARADKLGVSLGTQAAAQRSEARAGRAEAQRNRDNARTERGLAAADREDAARRQRADTPPTGLAMAFAGIAEWLYDADTLTDLLLRILEAAVSTVEGCRMATVTLRDRSGCRTAALTDRAAAAVDQLQYHKQEGPSLDALDTPIVYADSFPDERWPVLASDPTYSGVQSVVSYCLTPAGIDPADLGGGSLTLYGIEPAAFDQTARETGLILAAHASVAIRLAQERDVLQGLTRDLRQALLSRDVIGQAKGILMERLKVTPEDAFDLLSRTSQRLNVKLREVARRLAETGEIVL